MATPKFISEDSFIGSINIDFGTVGMSDDYAAEVEESILIDLLGYDVYKALMDDLDGNNDPQTQKYIDLVDGIEAGYTGTDGLLNRLKGIEEMLKYFFYFYHVRNDATFQTSAGGVFQLENQNSTKSPSGENLKLVNAWNLGVDLYNELVNFISYKNSEEGSDYYENWTYKTQEKINIFGI